MDVETYTDETSIEYPVRFRFGVQIHEVIEVEDRWFSTGITYYKVFADDANHYILKKNIVTESWSIRMLHG